MRRPILMLAASFAVTSACAPWASAQAPGYSFELLDGSVPGFINLQSVTNGLSGDGQAIVGTGAYAATPDRPVAFRWTKAGGFELLEIPTGWVWTNVGGMSRDGEFVVGWASNDEMTQAIPVRWDGAGAVTVYDRLQANPTANGLAGSISDDGTLIYGDTYTDQLFVQAVRYAPGQFASNLGTLPGYEFGLASGACAADGLTLFGLALSDVGYVAVRSINGGPFAPVALGSGQNNSLVYSCSPDATIAVGELFQDDTQQLPAVWKGNALPVTLAVPIDGGGTAFAATPSGGRIVGMGWDPVLPGSTTFAAIWDAPETITNLADLLVSKGVTIPPDLEFNGAHAVSHDGQTIVGQAYDTIQETYHLWVATVPIASCYADCDASGALNIDDFICFQTLFAIGDPAADCDASGSLNIDDFICFQTLFAIGC